MIHWSSIPLFSLAERFVPKYPARFSSCFPYAFSLSFFKPSPPSILLSPIFNLPVLLALTLNLLSPCLCLLTPSPPPLSTCSVNGLVTTVTKGHRGVLKWPQFSVNESDVCVVNGSNVCTSNPFRKSANNKRLITTKVRMGSDLLKILQNNSTMIMMIFRMTFMMRYVKYIDDG